MDGALTILCNPAAGSGRSTALIDRLRERVPEAAIVTSDEHDGVRALIADLALSSDETLAVLGGDGTIHQAVSGLFDAHDPPLPTLAIFPCGSGNALATALGVRSEAGAFSALFDGTPRSIDVARLKTDAGTSHAINVIGWGLPARVTARAAASRGPRGMPYTRAALTELLFGDISPVRVTTNAASTTHDILGLACLTPRSGGGIPVAPNALLDDGKLDLVRVDPSSRPRLLALFARLMRGRHLTARGVEHRLASTLNLTFDSPQPLVVDGEMQTTRHLTIKILPRALRVLVSH